LLRNKDQKGQYITALLKAKNFDFAVQDEAPTLDLNGLKMLQDQGTQTAIFGEQ